MATDSRVRAWSAGAVDLVRGLFSYYFARSGSEPAIAISEETRRMIELYFAEVTGRVFLDGLAEAVKKQTEREFAQGVQAENLVNDHATDKAIKERSVKLTYETLDKRWRRVKLACDCQTLPNCTVSTALFTLGLKRAEESSVLRHVRRETSYTVHLEPAGGHVRITLIFEVTLSCDWRSEELLFHHVFVVREDGGVVRIEKTTVDKVENIALGALE